MPFAFDTGKVVWDELILIVVVVVVVFVLFDRPGLIYHSFTAEGRNY